MDARTLYETDPKFRRSVEAAHRVPRFLIRQIKAERCARPGGLIHFVKLMWPFVEPSRDFIPGWHIDAMCEHLEAVTNGEIHRLLINIPPGHMKSLLVNVMYPAWEWGPKGLASTRYLCASYSQSLTVRDNVRFRQVILSEAYQQLWPHVKPSKVQFSLEKVSNTRTGWKVASSVSGTTTGERADRVVLDDPNSIKDTESDVIRNSTNTWFREVVPTRVNSPEDSAIIVIQQRTHEEDVSGIILVNEMGYEHLMIPMEWDGRDYTTSIGWRDPRAEHGVDGEICWPGMWPPETLAKTKHDMSEYAVSGQFQQMPVPRGGAIFETQWWRRWPPIEDEDEARKRWLTPDGKIQFPPFDFTLAAVDTAFTDKQENDYCAMVVWGVFRTATQAAVAMRGRLEDPAEMIRLAEGDRPKVMLVHAWQKRLTLHGSPEERPTGISDREWGSATWRLLRQKNWGLVEWVADTCKRYKVDHLLIETQAQGHGLEQELRNLNSGGTWGVQLVPAKGGKRERAYAVAHLFSNGAIFAPQYIDGGRPSWAQTVIDQYAGFPRGSHDDLVDAGTHGLQYLRDSGMLVRSDEFDESFEEELRFTPPPKPLYDV